jgi:hypothetical protein
LLLLLGERNLLHLPFGPVMARKLLLRFGLALERHLLDLCPLIFVQPPLVRRSRLFESRQLLLQFGASGPARMR